MSELDRYTRQRRLPEIGDAGQARIERATLRIPGGPGALTELIYLHRAGIGSVELDAFAAPPPFPHAGAFRHRAAARHAAASHRALLALLSVARGDGDPS